MAVTARTVLRAGRIGAAAVLLTNLVVIAAWVGQADADGSSRSLPWLFRDIKFNAAIGLGLLAASWLVDARARRSAARVVATCISVTAAIAGATVVEYVVGAGSGFDQWLVDDDTSQHGRMRLATAFCLLALAAARAVMMSAGGRRNRVAELLSLTVVAVAGVATIGYVFNEATDASSTGIGYLPLLTSIGLLVLAHVSLADVPDGFVAWVTGGRDSGAMLLRRVLPVAAFAVPAVNLLVVLARRVGVIPDGVGAPIAALTIMLLVTVALGYTARALRISDESRAEATHALSAVNYDLEQRVQERAEQLRTELAARDILIERDRIAADMHDHVIQRLYALGMDLERRAALAGFDADTTLDGVDAAIADLRHTIHDLRTAPPTHGLEPVLLDLGRTMAGHFDTPPTITVTGDTDAIAHDVRLNLLAVAREALSNAVRHSGARHLDITLVATDHGTTLTVSDDGRGIPDGVESTSGLRNIRDRATQCGGIATWQQRVPSGTTVTWFAPTRDTAAAPSTRRDVGEAVTVFAARLARGADGDALPAVAAQLQELLGCDAATVVVPGAAGMHMSWSVGFPAGFSPGEHTYPYAGSLTGHVATTRRPVRVNHLDETFVAATAAAAARQFGPTLAVPVGGAGHLHCVIALLRNRDGEPFTRDDEDTASLFATCVANLLDQHRTAGPTAPDPAVIVPGRARPR